MTEQEMMRRMDAVEFRKWMAFYLLEPFGDEYRQYAGLRSQIANSFGGKEGGGQFKESDFMPTDRSRQQSSEEMEQVLLSQLGMPKHGKPPHNDV